MMCVLDLQPDGSCWREPDGLVWVDSRRGVEQKLVLRRCGMGRKVRSFMTKLLKRSFNSYYL